MDSRILYIIKAHAAINHKYDGLPYHVHLKKVNEIAQQYIHLIDDEHKENVLIAAWGHDLLEDTHETYNDVKKELGEDVANIIYIVSNEKGKTRSERANDKYYQGIVNDKLALFVKLCDRIANMTYSKLYGNIDMFNKYKSELSHFKEKLYNGLYDELWDVLDKIDFTKKDEMYYKNIDKFDKNSVHCIHLPKPISDSLYNELFEKGILRKNELELNQYYYGKCRNANVAVWNGMNFVYMRTKFGSKFPEYINHLEDDNGFDLFIPVEKVIPNESEIIIYN
jgi:(p)ppGpp synthase/HD superfamily hydrolase